MRKEKFDIYLEKDEDSGKICERHHHTVDSMRFITAFIPPSVYPKMLDIGCGEGREAFILTQLGYKVVGITNGSLNIEYASKHFPEVDVKEMDMHDLEFAAGSFNGIFLHHTFEHSLAPFIQMIEMYSVLTDSPKGLVWVGLPDYREPGDKDFNAEINILNWHHRNMLSPLLFKQLFELCFVVKEEFFNKLNLQTDSIYFDQAYILEKKPFNDLHLSIQKIVVERKRLFE